jgi:hypothetical protein
VASFSRSGSSRWTHAPGSSPASARRSLANRETGWYGIVVDLRVGHDGQPLVEQAVQGPDDPGLGLAPLAEEDDVVAGQDGVLQLGQHGVLEAQHPGPPAAGRRRCGPRRCAGSPRPPGSTPPRLTQPAERGDVRRRGRASPRDRGPRAVRRVVRGSGVGHGTEPTRDDPPVVRRGVLRGARPSLPSARGPDPGAATCFARGPQGWKDDGPSAAPGRDTVRPERRRSGRIRPDEGETT